MRALITGATGGIGRELAKIFAANGHDLFLVARDAAGLASLARELAGVQTAWMAADLTSPSAPGEIFRETGRLALEIDTLVNNAGFGAYGPFSETDPAAEMAMIQVNVSALTHLTKLYLKEMLKNGSGKILNVASTAAFQPGPLMAVYYATKAYVLSFSEAVANEVKGTGVSVTVLCPGPTDTGFHKRAGTGKSKLVSGKFLNVMDARSVAEAGYRGLMKGKTVVIPGLKNKLMAESVRFAPRNMVTGIARMIQENRDGA